MYIRTWKNVDIVHRIYRFAYESVFNENIRPDIQGLRDNMDIFVNLFQGKIAELAVLLELQKVGYPVSYKELDLTLRKRGSWDIGDIVIKNSIGEDVYIDVKSIKKKSSNLLIETCRFNEDGSLAYENSDGSKHCLDAYSLVIVDFSKNLFDFDFYKMTEEDFFENLVIKTQFIGSITISDFWDKKKLVPRGTLCSKDNFSNIWNGFDFYCEVDESIISNPKKRTSYIQTDNYMVSPIVLENIETVFKDKLHIKKI